MSMSVFRARRFKAPLGVSALLGATLMLSGCVGGTTYGTGVSHEEATFNDIVNILSFRRDTTDIEYRPRPDLVVPEDSELVEPIDEASVAPDADWPETPEERIARVRAEAEAARGSTASENEFSRSQKRFGRAGRILERQEAPIGQGVPNVSCDPEGEIMRRCTPQEISRAVRAKREELSIGSTASATPTRRYLTEPPVEYRQPSSDAPMGDEGLTEAELAELERLRKERERQMNSWRR